MEPVKPYKEPGSNKKEEVGKMFDKIAPTYDFLNTLLSLGVEKLWRKKAIQVLHQYQSTGLLLDMATGTGAVAFDALKSGNWDRVVGMDISQGMLDIGKKRALKEHVEHKISFNLGESEHINELSDVFDACIVAYGVRNFDHLKQGLSEMLRVVKPGKPVVILEFSRLYRFPIKQLFHVYFRYLLPLIGRFFSNDPRAYQYLFESVQNFPSENELIELLQSCGYRETRFQRLSFGICCIYSGIK